MQYDFAEIGDYKAEPEYLHNFAEIGGYVPPEDRPEPGETPGILDAIGKTAKATLSVIPLFTLEALRSVISPLTAPLKGTRLDTDRLISEAIEYWREKTPEGIGIPDVRLTFDEGIGLERAPDIPIRDIAAAAARGAGFIAGPVRVAGRAAGLLTEKVAQTARPFYQSIVRGMATGALLGEGEKEKTLEMMALFGVFEPLAFGVGKATDLVKNIRQTKAWVKSGTAERGLMIQSLDDMIQINPRMTEAEILKTWNNPTWRREALERRIHGVEGAPKIRKEPIISPEPKPKGPAPKPEPVTELGKEFKVAVEAERPKSPLEVLKKYEVEIKEGNIDFAKIGKEIDAVRPPIELGEPTEGLYAEKIRRDKAELPEAREIVEEGEGVSRQNLQRIKKARAEARYPTTQEEIAESRLSPRFPLRDADALQSAPNNISRAIEEGGNLTSTLSKIPEGQKFTLGNLDDITREVVSSVAKLRSVNPEIFRSIVEAIPVDVMNDFVSSKRSAKDFFGDESVFKDKFAVDLEAPIEGLDRRIAFALLSGIERTETGLAAKFSSIPNVAWIADKGLIAKVTSVFHEDSLSQLTTEGQEKSLLKARDAEAPVIPEKPVAKEPWEMTRDDFSKSVEIKDPSLTGVDKGGDPVITPGVISIIRGEPAVAVRAGENKIEYKARGIIDGIPKPEPQEVATATIKEWHKGSVEYALSQGRSVSKSILAEYPDLKPPTAVEAEPTLPTVEEKQASDINTLYGGIPFKGVGKAIAGLKKTYDEHVGQPVWNFLSETLPMEAGNRSKIVDKINKGLILDYKKDPAFIELRDDTRFRIQQFREKAKETAKKIAEFPRAEQIRIAQIIKGSVTATPKRYEKAFEVIKDFQRLEGELQELGILGPDNRFRQLTRKEIATKFNEISEIDRKIEKLKKNLEPIVKISRMVRHVSEDISEEIISTTTETTEGIYETRVSKWSELNEERIREALESRGFGPGEATQMIERVKESVVSIEGQTGTLKEIREKVEKVVTKTITQEIERLKTYTPSMMARARGSIIKDINKQNKNRSEILERIRLHYKMSGKLYLTKAYESVEKESGFLSGIFKAIKKPRLKKGYDIQRKDLSKEYEEYLGIIRQAPYLVFKGLSSETHDVELMRMFNKISQNRNWAISPKELLTLQSLKDKAKQAEKYKDFKPLPVTEKLGPLSGAMIDPYIWDDLNEAVVITSNIIQAWDEILRLWKTGKVVFNPATQTRNLLSDIILADLAGLSPHRVDVYAIAARDMLGKSGYYEEVKSNTTLMGTEWAGTEIKEFLSDVSELKTGNFLVDSAKSIKKLLDKPGKLYQGIEQFFKLAVYVNERQGGASIKDAAKHAEKYLFNYQKLPPAIRWAKRWYSPFITFTFKALPRVAETAIRKPWKFAKYLILMSAVEEITRRMYGESEEEVEREKRVLPRYMRKSVLPGQLGHLRIPYRDQYNRSKYLDLTFILPWGDIGEQWGQGEMPFPLSVVPRPFMPNHPAYVIPAEWGFNEVFFTGQELILTSDTWEESSLKLGKQVWRQLAPSLAGSYSYNKLMSAWKGERDWALRDRPLGEAMFDVFLGIKLRSIDYNEELAKRIRELKKERDEIKYQFTKDYENITLRNPTPDVEDDRRRIDKIYKRLNKKLDTILQKMLAVQGLTE